MKRSNEYKIETMFVTRLSLQTTVIEKLKEGWELIYIIPNPINYMPMYSSLSFPAPIDQLAHTVNISLDVLRTALQQTMDSFEVGFIKFEEAITPCPRCSYPHAESDILDREA